jgi:hypothetical protein
MKAARFHQDPDQCLVMAEGRCCSSFLSTKNRMVFVSRSFVSISREKKTTKKKYIGDKKTLFLVDDRCHDSTMGNNFIAVICCLQLCGS